MQRIVFDTQSELKYNGSSNIPCSTLTPWEAHPFQLIIWFDMEQFAAALFCKISTALEQLNHDFVLKSELKNLVSIPESIDIKSSDREWLIGILESTHEPCQRIGLRYSAGAISEFLNELYKPMEHISPHKVSMRIEEIDRSIQREMRLHLFMHIPMDRAEYWQSWGENKRMEEGKEIPLFGNIVKEKFPLVGYDIKEAGNCFAAGRYTACVFHLMRILEIGLATIAKKFNVSSARENWGDIIRLVRDAIGEMKDNSNKRINWREEREFYSQAVDYLELVKDAWRNYTAHARAQYEEDDAEVILINVRKFMQKLAARLSEQ